MPWLGRALYCGPLITPLVVTFRTVCTGSTRSISLVTSANHFSALSVLANNRVNG